jgi:hypothetical protein
MKVRAGKASRRAHGAAAGISGEPVITAIDAHRPVIDLIDP